MQTFVTRAVAFSWHRAGARKSGRDGEARQVKPEERVDHMPHTQHYPVEDVLVDLLEVGLVRGHGGGGGGIALEAQRVF